MQDVSKTGSSPGVQMQRGTANTVSSLIVGSCYRLSKDVYGVVTGRTGKARAKKFFSAGDRFVYVERGPVRIQRLVGLGRKMPDLDSPTAPRPSPEWSEVVAALEEVPRDLDSALAEAEVDLFPKETLEQLVADGLLSLDQVAAAAKVASERAYAEWTRDCAEDEAA